MADRATRRISGASRCSRAMRQGEKVAALAAGEGVDLVDHDRLEAGEQERAVLIAEQQAQRFGRGQQDLRRPHPLARLAVGGRVAGAGLDPDRQAHLADRRQQIALDVDRERLERRDVERVEALGRRLDEIDDGSAGSPRASCPRPSARPATRSARRARRRASPADGAAAPSRLRREPVGNDRRQFRVPLRKSGPKRAAQLDPGFRREAMRITSSFPFRHCRLRLALHASTTI